MGYHKFKKKDLMRALEQVDDDDLIMIKLGGHTGLDYPFIGVDFPNIYPNYKELKDYCDKNGIKDEDKVKIIIIKDDML